MSKIRRFYYCGLEKYESRYTLQLTDWTKTFYDAKVASGEVEEFVDVTGETLSGCESIVTGQVLDAHGRTYYSVTQIANLIRLHKAGEIRSDDIIFFEDMATFGMDSLAYIMDQVDPSYRPRIYVRCLAQSIDPDDFVNSTGMTRWMKHYEHMVNSFVTAVLASNEEMVTNMKIAGWNVPIYNISGLSFGKKEVQSRVDSILPWKKKKRRVVFAARFDDEKQPDFYMDMIEKIHYENSYLAKSTEFCVVTGSSVLRSNNEAYLKRANQLAGKGMLKVYTDLSKNEYYKILNESRLLFNCALQDWTSNTVSEADALGCNVLYPAYRSFPEVFANDSERMYVPWSLDDAISKVEDLLDYDHHSKGEISDWNDQTISRMFDIMTGAGEQWNRSDKNYRKYVAQPKY
jgi:hypothetical protein